MLPRTSISIINDVDWSGKTALMWANLLGNHTMVQILLAEGAKVQLQDCEKKTALHYAARGGCLLCVKALLKFGADPTILDFNGHNPLHDSVLADRTTKDTYKMITELRNAGSDLEGQARQNGFTPLHLAVDKGLFRSSNCFYAVGLISIRLISPIRTL